MESGKTCVVVLVEGLPTDPSGASSACAVASSICGKHTGVSVCPDAVCYLTLHGATQHANRFQPLFGKRGGIKCQSKERQQKTSRWDQEGLVENSRVYARTTLAAWKPLGPFSRSNSTVSPSFKVRYPFS